MRGVLAAFVCFGVLLIDYNLDLIGLGYLLLFLPVISIILLVATNKGDDKSQHVPTFLVVYVILISCLCFSLGIHVIVKVLRMNQDTLDWFFQQMRTRVNKEDFDAFILDLNAAIDRIPPEVTKDRYFSVLLENLQKLKT